jgi:hypothetical protein
MPSALAVLLAGGTLYLLLLVRRLGAVVNHEPPASATPLIRHPDSLCLPGCTCRGQSAEQRP